MPHALDLCFSCHKPYELHNNSGSHSCKSFEFVASSSRNDKDILFCSPFQSESSNKVYNVTVWKQGDHSCSCMGWRTKRRCIHIEQVKANPEKYKSGGARLNASASSVIGTVESLTTKMADLEAAVKRGDSIELSKLQAEVDYQRAMFESAGAGLAERFKDVQARIAKYVYGNEEEKNVSGSAPVNVAEDSSDPFANL